MCPPTNTCSRLCVDDGRCSPAGGVCRALSDEDCSESVKCKRLGQCRALGGRCFAGGEVDCAYSCAIFGNCVLKDGLCQPGSHDDCAKSLACMAYGTCKLDDDICSCERTDAGCVPHESNPDRWEANGVSGMSWARPPPEADPDQWKGKGPWCGYYAWPSGHL